ncbi:MAG: hypothetical protein ACXADY_04320 [Candidatus Hodarchaeales archaeon]|jgi:hypothetical protein
MLEKGEKSSQDSLVIIRQKQDSYQINDIVLDFLDIWEIIHHQAPNLSLSAIKNFSESILQQITIPFYQKFKELSCIEKYDSWLKKFSSIVINWPGMGRILFPLRLITYEIINHEDGLFNFYLQKILTKEISGTADNLFNLLFPKLVNVAIPLTENDLIILKSLQLLQADSSDIFKGANVNAYSSHLDVSSRTIVRRMKNIHFLQIPIAMHFLDMAQLGYETFLLSHFQPIPDNLKPYALNSVDLVISQFSLFQVPVTKTNVYLEIQDKLEPMIFQQIDTRIQNLNLNGLSTGKDGWKIPPPFLYCDPSLQIVSSSAAMDISLKPDFDTFRPLNSADIKILEFITTTGSLKNRKQLSQAIKVSLPETSRRIDEYHKHNLIHKVFQFFNIGLDLSISFFISCPIDHNISWIPHFLAFPKVDVFSCVNEQNFLFFGHVKLPPKWFKDFNRRVQVFKKEFNDLKFYYTANFPDIPKWSLTLSDTYF